MSDADLVIVVDARCAYCGLDHQIQIKARYVYGDKPLVRAVALTEGIDVLNWHVSTSIIERGDCG